MHSSEAHKIILPHRNNISVQGWTDRAMEQTESRNRHVRMQLLGLPYRCRGDHFSINGTEENGIYLEKKNGSWTWSYTIHKNYFKANQRFECE